MFYLLKDIRDVFLGVVGRDPGKNLIFKDFDLLILVDALAFWMFFKKMGRHLLAIPTDNSCEIKISPYKYIKIGKKASRCAKAPNSSPSSVSLHGRWTCRTYNFSYLASLWMSDSWFLGGVAPLQGNWQCSAVFAYFG